MHWTLFILAGLVVTTFMHVVQDPFQSIGYHFSAVWNQHGVFFIMAVLMLPILVFDCFKLSNRFVGPVFRLRETINRLAAGEDTQPLSFRDGDFWKALAQDFNNMVDRLSQQGSKEAKSS